MAVELSTQAQAIISEMVAKGQYSSEREILEQGVLLVWQAEMRASIQDGIAAVRRGEGFEMTEEFWDELIREADELDAQERLQGTETPE